MADIKVPKPPRKAFNPRRPASDLLQNQVKHLEWAVRHAGERRAEWSKVKPVKTEADAAARMSALLPRLASAANLPFAVSQIQEDTVRQQRARSASRRAARNTRPKAAKKARAKR